jgi:transposase
MGKSFRADDLNQSLLFPPSLHDWLPDNHLARFLADVVNALDLDAIYLSYSEKDGRGMAAYAPAMMVRVLLYGYATGVYSSRKIQSKTYDDVAFRFLSADWPSSASGTSQRWAVCLRRRCSCAPRPVW